MSEAADSTPKKKGLGPLAWIGIGCAGIVVLGAIVLTVAGFFAVKKVKEVAGDFGDNPAMAAAEWIVKASPEMDLVSKDEENGRLTVRNTKTGEVVTVDVEDIAEGKISFITDEGEVDVQMDADQGRMKITGGDGTTEFGGSTAVELPDWLPVYPGAEVEGIYSTTGPEGRTGSYKIVTDDPPGKALEFFRQALEERGFIVRTTTLPESAGGGMLTATTEDGKRTAHVVSVMESGAPQLGVTYSDNP